MKTKKLTSLSLALSGWLVVSSFAISCAKKTGSVPITRTAESPLSVALKPCLQSGKITTQASSKGASEKAVCRFQPSNSGDLAASSERVPKQETVRSQLMMRSIKGRSVALQVHLGFEDVSPDKANRLQKGPGEKLVQGVQTVCAEPIRRVFARSGVALDLKMSWVDPSQKIDPSLTATVPVQSVASDEMVIDGELYPETISSNVPTMGFCYQVLARVFETMGRTTDRECPAAKPENPEKPDTGAKTALATVKVTEESFDQFRKTAQSFLEQGRMNSAELIELFEPVCPGFGGRLERASKK